MLFLAGCGAEDPSIQFLHWPIIGGTLDNNAAHNAIVAIKENHTLCSGALISPRVIMTAAHCAKNTDLSAYTIYFGKNANGTLDPSLIRHISDFSIADGYSNKVIGAYDLALFKLSSDPPDGVIPIPNLPKSLEITQLDIDKPLVYVGYGKITVFDNVLDYGVRYTMTHNLNWVCIDDVSVTCSDFGTNARQNTICENQGATGICNGDSGGPALIDRNGKTYVAGVSSFVGAGCTNYGCSTKVDAYENFISDFVKNGLGASCSSPDDCSFGFCVESICCDSKCEAPCNTCKTNGKCQPVEDGTSCSDLEICNGDEVCRQGQCIPGAFQPDGAPCSDNLACNGEEVCKAGKCTPGIPLNCDDGKPNTLDWCDDSLGCIHDVQSTGLDDRIVGGCNYLSEKPKNPDMLLIMLGFIGLALLWRRRSW
jgi:hypothetical protein